ncbi:hypothetical protein EUX98_g774 [Antrodiella citrinella]|uniref:Uncharacterized protein n=1 Tax=Antrodiella citrinella TaxID=2447956 RepID=A0A4S4NBQ9_9APHY|nr:hypothetical protein EUX98_g774 [Antrodiella citrinella]
MLSLIRARIPSIVVWTTLESSFIAIIAYQWAQMRPSMTSTPLKSAIPKGHLGAARYHRAHGKTLAA